MPSNISSCTGTCCPWGCPMTQCSSVWSPDGFESREITQCYQMPLTSHYLFTHHPNIGLSILTRKIVSCLIRKWTSMATAMIKYCVLLWFRFILLQLRPLFWLCLYLLDWRALNMCCFLLVKVSVNCKQPTCRSLFEDLNRVCLSLLLQGICSFL